MIPISKTRRLLSVAVLSFVAVVIVGPPLAVCVARQPSPLTVSTSQSTQVILVRHADRNGKADELTELGKQRSQELIHVLEKSGVDIVFHTELSRTAATAAPLCEKLGLTPKVIPAQDVAKLVEAIRSEPAGRRVLVVGHSNTVPEIVKALGGPEFAIADDEFDDLVILTLRRDEAPSVLRLQYGARTP